MGNKSHRWRDVWIYVTVRELQRSKGWTLTRVMFGARKEIESMIGLLLSPKAYWDAYRRGKKTLADKNFKYEDYIQSAARPDSDRKKIGHRAPDAVNNYIMYQAVCEALEAMAKSPRPNMTKAYQVASRNLKAEWKGISSYVKFSPGRVRYAYELIVKKLQ